MAPSDSRAHPGPDEGGVAEALRAAIERTLAATAPTAGQTRERAGGFVGETRERAGGLVDEISKRGQEARGEIARRGQEAGAEIARIGQEAREAVSRRGPPTSGEVRAQLEAIERRLASIEELLGGAEPQAGPRGGPQAGQADPKAEA